MQSLSSTLQTEGFVAIDGFTVPALAAFAFSSQVRTGAAEKKRLQETTAKWRTRD